MRGWPVRVLCNAKAARSGRNAVVLCPKISGPIGPAGRVAYAGVRFCMCAFRAVQKPRAGPFSKPAQVSAQTSSGKRACC